MTYICNGLVGRKEPLICMSNLLQLSVLDYLD